MKNLFLKSTLALVSVFSMGVWAQSSIGERSDWQYLRDSPIHIKPNVLRGNRVPLGIGNSVDQAFARAEQNCSSAVRKEEERGVRVLAMRVRIVDQVATYMYTAECDLQVMTR